MARKRFNPAGVVFDVPPEEVPDDVYNTADNIIFRDGVAARVAGVANIFDGILFQPKFLIQTESGEDLYWIYCSDENIGAVLISTHTDLTPAGGITGSGIDNEWTGGLLNGVPFVNNLANDPLFWDENPANNFEVLPGWPANTKCDSMAAFKYHLFALGVTESGDSFGGMRIFWSGSAVEGQIPTEWIPSPTNEAGDDTLSETRGPIIGAMVLRDSLIIYKRFSCYIVDYIAGNLIFSNRLLFAEVGMMAHNCAVEVFGEHYVFATGDIYTHDGHTVTTIADEIVRKKIFQEIDNQTFVNSYVVWDPLQKAVLFCYPQTGNVFPNIAAVYKIPEGSWSFRFIHRTAPNMISGIVNEPNDDEWDDDDQAWIDDATVWNQAQYTNAVERVVQCNYDESKLYAMDIGNTNDLELVEGTLQKLTMDLDDNSQVKTVSTIWPRTQGDGAISVRLGTQEHPQENILWGPYEVFEIGSQKVDYFATGRYISIEFKGENQPHWSVSGFELQYENVGAW